MAANSHDKVVLFDVAFSADKKFVAACKIMFFANFSGAKFEAQSLVICIFGT